MLIVTTETCNKTKVFATWKKKQILILDCKY